MTRAEPFVRDRRFAFDLALCAVVTMFTAIPLVLAGTSRTSYLLALAISLPLLVRRMLPTLAFVAMLVGALLTVSASSHLVPLVGLPVPILIYSLARWSSQALARFALAAGVFGSFLGPFFWVRSQYGIYELVLFGAGSVAALAVVGAAYVIGRRRHESQANVAQQEASEAERARLVQAEQVQRDQAMAVAERNRIARELHDIVAHSLSVIVVQAEGGRALAARRPERAAEVLGTIAETGREALGEMRRIVGVLRTGREPGGADYVPAPGLDDIGELVERTSDRAELAVFGTPPPVSPALGLAAYRLVQESLTNVLKHAGPGARSRVTLAYTATAVEIEVSDNGTGPDPGSPADGSGHGLQGMAERVAMHGGELTAQPGTSGGWVVRARLPYEGPPGPGPAIATDTTDERMTR